MTKEKTKTGGSAAFSDVTWDKLKNLKLDIYALPNQKLEMHAERKLVEPDGLYLKLKSSAVLPALEDALKSVEPGDGMQYELSQSRDFVVIRQVSKE